MLRINKVTSIGPGTKKILRRAQSKQECPKTERWEQLTLGKAVPRVDMAVVDVHDVHALVTHEVPFMPIAL